MMPSVIRQQYAPGAVFASQEGSGSVVQTHVVEARPNLQASIVARPLVTQTHVVTARAVAQGSTVNAPTVEVGSITVVTARPVVQSSAVNAPSIVQTHVLTARPSFQGGMVTRPGLTQTHTVTARHVVQASKVNAPWAVAGGTFTGLSPADLVAIRAAVRAELSAELLRISEIAKLHGLVQGAPLVVTPTSRTAGDVAQTVNTAGATTTVTRQ